MPRLSDIEVALTAQDKTGSAFSSASKRMAAFGSAAGGIAASVALVGGAMLTAAKSAIDFAGDLNDAAKAAGLNVETYQALQYQAGLSGVRAEEFGSAMTRATKTIGDAATGNKAAAETFARLGVSVRTASGDVRPTEDVIRDVSDSIAGMGTQAEKSSAAAAIFGRSAGPALVPLLEQGAQGIDAFIVSGKEMGLVISEDLIRKGDDAGDKLDTLAGILKTTLAGALLEVAPLISEAATGLAEAAVAASDFWQAFRDTDVGEKRLQRLGEEILAVQRSIEAKSTGSALQQYMSGGEEAVARLRTELKELQADVQRTALAMSATPAAERSQAAAPEETQAALVAARAEEAERKRLARERAAAEKESLRDVTEFEGAEQLRSQMATEEYHSNLEALNRGFREREEEERKALLEQSFADVTESSGATLDVWNEAYGELMRSAEVAADGVATAFEDILFAGFRDGTDGMLDAFKGVLAEMALELARAKLREALTSVFGSILGAAGGKSVGDATLSKAGASGISGGAKFASGGSFVVPGSSTGDNVIPFFRANGGEKVTITPAGGSRDSGGGGDITIIQHINAPGASAGDEARLRQAAKQGADEAVARIVDMRSRNRL